MVSGQLALLYVAAVLPGWPVTAIVPASPRLFGHGYAYSRRGREDLVQQFRHFGIWERIPLIRQGDVPIIVSITTESQTDQAFVPRPDNSVAELLIPIIAKPAALCQLEPLTELCSGG